MGNILLYFRSFNNREELEKELAELRKDKTEQNGTSRRPSITKEEKQVVKKVERHATVWRRKELREELAELGVLE